MAHNCPNFEPKFQTTGSDSVSVLGKCAYCNQSVPDTELVLCDKCNAKHCLPHRHYDSHRCTKNEPNKDQKTPSLAAKPMTNTSGPNVKGTKNESLAQKVALMKLKQKASGQSSVPMSERLYFRVEYQRSAEQNNFDTKEMFLSKEWSVGKCIDWLASHLSLVNNNNNPMASKLVLSLVSEDKQVLPMSQTLKQLESEGLFRNGDTVCLKYVQ